MRDLIDTQTTFHALSTARSNRPRHMIWIAFLCMALGPCVELCRTQFVPETLCCYIVTSAKLGLLPMRIELDVSIARRLMFNRLW